MEIENLFTRNGRVEEVSKLSGIIVRSILVEVAVFHIVLVRYLATVFFGAGRDVDKEVRSLILHLNHVNLGTFLQING
jgi:hypothetical protein